MRTYRLYASIFETLTPYLVFTALFLCAWHYLDYYYISPVDVSRYNGTTFGLLGHLFNTFPLKNESCGRYLFVFVFISTNGLLIYTYWKYLGKLGSRGFVKCLCFLLALILNPTISSEHFSNYSVLSSVVSTAVLFGIINSIINQSNLAMCAWLVIGLIASEHSAYAGFIVIANCIAIRGRMSLMEIVLVASFYLIAAGAYLLQLGVDYNTFSLITAVIFQSTKDWIYATSLSNGFLYACIILIAAYVASFSMGGSGEARIQTSSLCVITLYALVFGLYNVRLELSLLILAWLSITANSLEGFIRVIVMLGVLMSGILGSLNSYILLRNGHDYSQFAHHRLVLKPLVDAVKKAHDIGATHVSIVNMPIAISVESVQLLSNTNVDLNTFNHLSDSVKGSSQQFDVSDLLSHNKGHAVIVYDEIELTYTLQYAQKEAFIGRVNNIVFTENEYSSFNKKRRINKPCAELDDVRYKRTAGRVLIGEPSIGHAVTRKSSAGDCIIDYSQSLDYIRGKVSASYFAVDGIVDIHWFR